MTQKFDTLAVHAGAEPDRETGAVAPPLHFSTTFVHAPPGETDDFSYQRAGNPTQRRLETALAALEGGEVVIARGNVPAVRLVPVAPRGKRDPAALKGKIAIDARFDEPLPEDELAGWHPA